MSDLPTHLIESSRYGWNNRDGKYRLAHGDQNVKNSLRGLFGRFGEGIAVRVLALPGYEDVTSTFVLGESNGEAPF